MHRIFIANGSGNEEDETAYCYSFNTLCVGGFIDNGTIGVGNFDDVVLSWDQCPAMTASDISLRIDLDMTVRGPSSPAEEPLVFSNVSAVDNYEMVEFEAPRQGEYLVNIQAQSWGVCPVNEAQSTHIAVAWTRS